MSDQTILADIEAKAAWLQRDASLLTEFTCRLAQRPTYETLAEEQIDKAEQVLVDALKQVRKARKTYNSRPTNV